MNYDVIISQIGILGLVMLIGYLIVKLGYVEANIKDALSKIIVKLVLPCLVLSSVTKQIMNPQMIHGALITVGISALSIFILYVSGKLSVRILRIKGKTTTVHEILSTTGNVIFIGYPVILAVFGETGVFYAIIYWLLNDSFLWTIGVFKLCKDQGVSSKAALKKLLNPNTVSFAIAIIMLCSGLHFPKIIFSALDGIGGLTTHLSMIFIGMTLATIDLKNIYKRYSIFVICLVKMLIIPIGLIFLFRFLKIEQTILGAVVLEAAMPAQTVLSILSNEYNSDFEYTAEAVFITTVVSLASIPLVYYFITIIN